MKTNESLPLEHCHEYDSAAEWCAERGLKGAIGDPLPANMATDGALKWIQADPEAFEKRVREYAYGLAMECDGENHFKNGSFVEPCPENGTWPKETPSEL